MQDDDQKNNAMQKFEVDPDSYWQKILTKAAEIESNTTYSDYPHVRDLQVLDDQRSYMIRQFMVQDDIGLVDIGGCIVCFVKGDKNNPEVFRQSGVTTEGLLLVVKKYLEENNVLQFKNQFTDLMIYHIDEALRQVDLRAEDRKNRGVQGTYQK